MWLEFGNNIEHRYCTGNTRRAFEFISVPEQDSSRGVDTISSERGLSTDVTELCLSLTAAREFWKTVQTSTRAAGTELLGKVKAPIVKSTFACQSANLAPPRQCNLRPMLRIIALGISDKTAEFSRRRYFQ